MIWAGFLALAVVARSRSQTPASAQRWNLGPLVMAALLYLAAWLVAFLARNAQGVPYNVRELLQDQPVLVPATLVTVLLGSGWLTMLMGRYWLALPLACSGLLIPLALLWGGLVAAALIAVVPTEAIDDIVGSPMLAKRTSPVEVALYRAGIDGNVERGLRFVGLYCMWITSAVLAVRLTLGRFRARDAWPLPPLLLLLLFSFFVTIHFAGTNNVYELLPGDGRHPRVVALPCLVLVQVATASVLVLAWQHRGPRRASVIAFSLACLVLSLPSAWLLFQLGTKTELHKYGQTFSAAQFLLSPGREQYLDSRSLMIRFAIVHLGVVWVWASGLAMGVWAFRRTPKQRADSHAPGPGELRGA